MHSSVVITSNLNKLITQAHSFSIYTRMGPSSASHLATSIKQPPLINKQIAVGLRQVLTVDVHCNNCE